MLKERAEAIRGQVTRALELPMSESDLNELRKTSARLERICNVLELRPCTAIYGQSQVGKSYLVNRVLAKQGRPVKVKLGTQTIDFIDEINPLGDQQEATGVVTRFSSISSPEGDFPLRIRLFRPIEIIQILVDSFLQDVCSQNMGKSLVEQAVNEWSTLGTPTNSNRGFISHNELQELREFCEESGLLVPSEFWDDTRENIDKLSSQVPILVQRFAVLWANNEYLSTLCNLLLDEYQAKGLEEELHSSTMAVLREHGGIVDVKALGFWFDSGADPLVDCLTSNGIVEIRCSILAALTKEVTLPLDVDHTSEQSTFIHSSDFLDFPGARPSLGGITMTENRELKKPFLRSKVRHLFRSYATSMEVENLLWCWNGANLNAVETPSDVGHWMEKCVGRNTAERSKYLVNRGVSPLACVHTWFNVDMDKMLHSTNDVRRRLEGRFGEHFKEQIASKVDWFTGNWSESIPDFDELHFLRDPQWSQNLFNGGEQNGVHIEDSVNPDVIDKFDDFFEVLKANEVIVEHCKELREKWEGISKPNKVGSDSILLYLNNASQNSGIEIRMCEELQVIKSNLLNLLSSLTQSDDLEDQLVEAERKATTIRQELISATMRFSIQNAQDGVGFLDSFESLIQVESSEVLEWHADLAGGVTEIVANEEVIARTFLETIPGLNQGMSLEERLSSVADFLGGDLQEARAFVSEANVDLSRLFLAEMLGASHRVVQVLLTKVAEEKLSDTGEAFTFLRDWGVSQEVVSNFFAELAAGLEERSLGARVSSSLDEYYRTHHGVRAIEPHVVSRFIAFWWNEFLFKCDHRFFSEDEIQQLHILRDVNKPATLKESMNDILSTSNLPRTERMTAWYESIRNIASANTNLIEVDRELMVEIRDRRNQIARIQLPCDD